MKFIKYFICEWFNYPCYKDYKADLKKRNPKEFRKMEAEDRKKGIKPYKNRFDFAFRIAKIKYAHRDRYGRKCRKYGFDCDKCNAKHC